jgi:hypothetical protein
MASQVARSIAIRNAVAARAAGTDGTIAAKSPRAKGPDLERIISGEASRSTMRRFLKSIESIDGDLLSVDQSRAAQAAEEALAPVEQDRTPFEATIEFETVESKNAADETPYFVMRGCEVAIPGGETVKRTVLAFGSAHSQVKDLIFSGQPLTVRIAQSGSVLKVVEEAQVEAA